MTTLLPRGISSSPGYWRRLRQRCSLCRLVLGVVLVLGAGGFTPAPEPGPTGQSERIPADVLDAVDEHVQDQMEELGLPGVQLAIVKNGRLVHLSAFGVADASGRALTPQTPVMLASTSKSLTAIAVMQQVDAGRLDLTAPVNDYLPWFRTADKARSARITVGQLLNHTSGFSERDGRAYQDTDDRSLQALEQGVRNLADVTLVDEPGHSFTYSNLNYDVLGLLVQTVSDEEFSQYMAKHVFTPLQMPDSHGTAQNAIDHGAAAGYYEWFGSSWRPTDIPVPTTGMPSATMYSSAQDMSHLLIALLSDGQYEGRPIVSSQSAAALLTPTAKVDDFNSYAMGWFARPLWETLNPQEPHGQSYDIPLILEHNGSWSNTQTFLAMVPNEALGVVLLVNGASQATPSVAQAMHSNVLRILHAQPPTPATVLEEPLQRYGWVVAMVLLIAEIASLIICAYALYRWVRSTQPPSRRRIAIIAILPLILDAGILWLALVYIPVNFNTDLPVIIRTVPDAGLFLLPALILAAGWGAIRTTLITALWYRNTRQRHARTPTAPEPSTPSR